MKRKKWAVFAGCCMLGLVYTGMICNTAGLYFSDMAAELQVSMAEVTLTMSFLNGGGLLGMFAAGKLVGRTDLRVLMSACTLASGTGLLLSAVFPVIWPYYIVWGIIGFSAPFLLSVTVPMLLGQYFPKKMGAKLGMVYGIAGIGGAVFNAVIGNWIRDFGWRTSFLAEGMITLFCLLPFTAAVLRQKPGENHAETVPRKEKTANSAVLERAGGGRESFFLFMIVNLALTVVSSLIQQISPHVRSLGFDITVSAWVMSAVMIGCACGNVLIGKLLDRFQPERITGIFLTGAAVGLVSMIWKTDSRVLMCAGVLIGFGQAVFQTGIPYCVQKIYGTEEYGRIYPRICMPGSVTGIFSAALGGLLFDLTGSYTGMLVLLACMEAVAASCIAAGMKGALEKKKNRKACEGEIL